MAKANLDKSQTNQRTSRQGSKDDVAAVTVYRHGAPSEGTIPYHPTIQNKLTQEKQHEETWLEEKDRQQHGDEIHNVMELHQKAAPGVFRNMDPQTLKKLAAGDDTASVDPLAHKHD